MNRSGRTRARQDRQTQRVPRRKRVLFVCSDVSLAHIARSVVLAKCLDPLRYDVHFATGSNYAFVLDGAPFTESRIRAGDPDTFLRRISSGKPLFDHPTLAAQTEEEMRLLERIRPDLVIGDLRFSLSVSARVSGVPYATLMNAHWSPFAQRPTPVPEHFVVRLLGAARGQRLFDRIAPTALGLHCGPMNRLRKDYGFEPLPSLPHVYTDADHTLYPDVPGLIPTARLPSTHHYLGPLVWSPEIVPPKWWDTVPKDSESAYVTLGSTGRAAVLPAVIDALGALPLHTLVATADRSAMAQGGARLWQAKYLPGSEAARRSRFVVCNGGSATVYQALAEGTPVLGIPTNMDQYLTMHYVQRAGAGILIRSDEATPPKVRDAARVLCRDPSYERAARRVAHEFAGFNARSRMEALLAGILDLQGGASRSSGSAAPMSWARRSSMD